MECNRKIGSLLSLSLDYVVYNLSKYMNNEWAIVLKHLPTHIKDRILQKFTKSPYFWRKVNFTGALTILMHANTKEIDLTSCNMDDNILNIIKECKYLSKLNLMRFGTHEMTSEGLADLFSHTSQISFLQISNCSAVNDDVIEHISKFCPHLMALDVGGCKKVTDASLEKLSKLNNLTWLILSNTQITDKGIEWLVKGNSGSKLRELRLADCANLTDQILKVIVTYCPQIEVLVFSNCNKINDMASLELQSDSLKNLKQLMWTIQW